jgi:hypothetical protein
MAEARPRGSVVNRRKLFGTATMELPTASQPSPSSLQAPEGRFSLAQGASPGFGAATWTRINVPTDTTYPRINATTDQPDHGSTRSRINPITDQPDHGSTRPRINATMHHRNHTATRPRDNSGNTRKIRYDDESTGGESSGTEHRDLANKTTQPTDEAHRLPPSLLAFRRSRRR